MIKNILIPILLISLFLPGMSILAQEEQGEMLIVNPDMEMIMNADMQFMFCEDYQCSKEKTDFFINEPFFMTYKSNIKLPVIAIIKLLDADFEDRLVLPDYYIFKEKGDYEISFEIQVENLKNMAKKKKIIVKSRCMIDGQCLEKETEQNCPQDCIFIKENIFNLKSIIFFVILFFIIGLIGIRYVIIKRKEDL